MLPHLLFEFLLERSLVFAQITLLLSEIILLQLDCQLAICLEGSDIVLMLIQQMLDLLFVYLSTPSCCPSGNSACY